MFKNPKEKAREQTPPRRQGSHTEIIEYNLYKVTAICCKVFECAVLSNMRICRPGKLRNIVQSSRNISATSNMSKQIA